MQRAHCILKTGTLLIAVSVAFLQCRSYPEIKSNLDSQPSVGIFLDIGKLSISMDYSKNLLNEAINKRGEAPIPSEFSRLGTLIENTFREKYPLRSVKIIQSETDNSVKTIIKADLGLYYDVNESAKTFQLNARMDFFFIDASSRKQIRFVPGVAKTHIEKKYDEISLDHFISVTPPLEILPGIESKVKTGTERLVGQIKNTQK